MKTPPLSAADISEVIALAWADEVSFDEIEKRLGLSEPMVIKLMRQNLKSGSFKVWRARVSGRKSKHQKLLRSRVREVSNENDGGNGGIRTLDTPYSV
jgi:uncharacterized protein (TIGR03643 family)